MKRDGRRRAGHLASSAPLHQRALFDSAVRRVACGGDVSLIRQGKDVSARGLGTETTPGCEAAPTSCLAADRPHAAARRPAAAFLRRLRPATSDQRPATSGQRPATSGQRPAHGRCWSNAGIPLPGDALARRRSTPLPRDEMARAAVALWCSLALEPRYRPRQLSHHGPFTNLIPTPSAPRHLRPHAPANSGPAP